MKNLTLVILGRSLIPFLLIFGAGCSSTPKQPPERFTVNGDYGFYVRSSDQAEGKEPKIEIVLGGVSYQASTRREQSIRVAIRISEPENNFVSYIGFRQLGKIRGGQRIRGGKFLVPYKVPPYGRYQVSVLIESYHPGKGWWSWLELPIKNQSGRDNRFVLGGHAIIGSSAMLTNLGPYSIVGDYKIDTLRIRQVRRTEPDCEKGYVDHLEFDGAIGSESTFGVHKLLENIEPCVMRGKELATEIYLNSGGGYLTHGFELGRIFQKYNVHASVLEGQQCSSACAIAFLGAAHRGMSANGELLFHAPYRVIPVGRDTKFMLCGFPEDTKALNQYYLEMLGAEDGNRLFDRTLSYCSDSDGWTINEDAARLYGIVTVE